MHHYPFHPGDYMLVTAHLDPLEDLAYRRLLDLYYSSEKHIPLETHWVARRIRLDSDLIEKVLKEFFELTEDGWKQSRCDDEIAKYQALVNRNKANGTKGGRPQKPSGFPVGTQWEPSGKPTKNQEPRTKNHSVPPKGPPDLILTSDPPAPPSGAGKGVTEGAQSKRLPTTPQSKRIAAIMHRQESTPWSEKEIKAYKALGIITEDDLAAVEGYYAANWPPKRDANMLRHNLLTFLNNFAGELDRAKASTTKPKTNDKRQYLHHNGTSGLLNAPGRYDKHGTAHGTCEAHPLPTYPLPSIPSPAGSNPG